MLNEHGTCFVDNTALSAVASCSTKALLRHGFGYTTVSEAPKLLAGRAGHAAGEHWLKGGTVDEALAIFWEQYGKWAEETLPRENAKGYINPLGWQSTSEILRYWLEENRPETLPLIIKPEMVEVGFQLPLTNETVRSPKDGKLHPKFISYGRLDAFGARRTDRSLWGQDFKFTTRVDDGYMDQFCIDSQISNYTWATRRTLGTNVRGLYIIAIQLFFSLPQSNRKCTTHQVSYEDCRSLHVVSRIESFTRTEEQLEEWWKTAVHLARRYRDLCERFPRLEDIHRVRQQGMFHKECRWCHFKDWCESGRPTWAQGVLVHDPWQPFDPAEG